MKQSLSILLSLALAFFLVDGAVSLLDDSLILLFEIHALTFLRGILSVVCLGAMLGVYILMGISPMVPKRILLPVVLMYPFGVLVVIPASIFYFSRLQEVSWALSFLQVLIGLAVVYRLRGAKLQWPLLTEEHLGERRFSGWNLAGFAAVNALVIFPGVALYLGLCTSLAVDHYSGGFVTLRGDGVGVRARTYVRDDGKKIQLIPMAHIGQAQFYADVSKSFASNSVVLLEGVSDSKNLIKQKLSYKRMATSLGLSEQQEIFEPGHGKLRHADIDVEQFSSSTIEFLNLMSRIHAEGVTVDNIRALLQTSQTPTMQEQLWKDILTKRNDHLVAQIRTELDNADNLVVPWGAAHMPGVAQEIQRMGFKLARSQEHQILKYRDVWRSLGGNPTANTRVPKQIRIPKPEF